MVSFSKNESRVDGPLYLAGLILIGILTLFSPSALADCSGVCRSNEVLVGEDQTHCYCVDRHQYAQCIGRAGEALKREIGGVCGRQYERCFRNNSIQISIATATCLTTSLFGCGAGMAACAAACNVGFTASEWAVAHVCAEEISPCYEEALVNDRKRKEACKM
jgi:hypothetical protein